MTASRDKHASFVFSDVVLSPSEQLNREPYQNQRRQEGRPPLEAVRASSTQGQAARSTVGDVALGTEAAHGRPSRTSWLPVVQSRDTADFFNVL